MILTKKHKWFLFDNNYVTAKVLDAAYLGAWQDYFINNFRWELSEHKDAYGFYRLYLRDKKTDDIEYTIGINWQGDDFHKMLTYMQDPNSPKVTAQRR